MINAKFLLIFRKEELIMKKFIEIWQDESMISQVEREKLSQTVLDQYYACTSLPNVLTD